MKKRVLSLGLAVIMVVMMLPVGMLNASAKEILKLDRYGFIIPVQKMPTINQYGFIGNVENPENNCTVIYTVEDLQNIKNNLSGNYVLGNDIDFSDHIGNWESIGSYETPFTGTFDGRGYRIINFDFPEYTSKRGILFGCTSKATIKNVGLVAPNNKVSNAQLVYSLGYGSLLKNCFMSGNNSGNAMFEESKGTVEDCYVLGDIRYNGSGDASGLGGVALKNSKIMNCFVKGSIYLDIEAKAGKWASGATNYGYSSIGGLCSGNGNSCKIENSFYEGNITLKRSAGGAFVSALVAPNASLDIRATVKNCYAKSNIIVTGGGGTYGSSAYIAHISGVLGAQTENCFFEGDFDVNDFVSIQIEPLGYRCSDSYAFCSATGKVSQEDLFNERGDDRHLKINLTPAQNKCYYDIPNNLDVKENWIKINKNEVERTFSGIKITGTNMLTANSETSLTATRYDENGNVAPEGGITWSCNDESVAQITPWGNNVTVKGLKGGKATITATHTESGMRATHEFEVVSYVMTLAGGYTVMLDEELEINYAVKQGEEYVHNDLDIKWEIESKDSNNAVKIISDKDNAYTRALTVKGINEGECELVAKVDGAELGRTKIEVLGNLADTINDETIIRAKYLVNNSQYKYYKNYNSVHGMFADEMDLTPSIVKYSLDNYLSVFYKSIYKGKAPDEVTATEFYECVLVKLLNDDENVKVFGKVGDVMSDYILKYGKKIAEKGTKIDDTNKKQLKEICKGLCGDGLEDVGFIDTLLISGKSIETYFEEYAKIYQMASCTNEQIKAIKLIKNSTSDKALKTACDNVIKSIEKAQADTAKYAVSSGTTKTAEQLSEYAFEKMVGALEKFSPALAAFDLVKEITSPINNILFQTDDIESDTIDLYALIVIENALKDAMESAEKTFNSNPTAEKAENLMAAADFYKNVQLYGCDICDSLLENYGEAKRNQGIAWDTLVIIMKNVVNREVKMSDVFNALFGNVDAETLDNRKTLSDIRKLIDSADFYGSEGTDVAEFIREVKSTTPSEWAKPEIKKATDYGFLPDYMQNNYQNNITRAEFCTILTWMIEEKTGKGIGQLIEEKGTPIKSPFEDTYYEYADYMCKLGIVNGVSATEFNPLGEITREQAATMLMRTADVLGYDTSYNTSVESGVSSWATEGVGFVTENGIMNGTGNGFEPQGKYTKEQAIATFVRMYDNLK